VAQSHAHDSPSEEGRERAQEPEGLIWPIIIITQETPMAIIGILSHSAQSTTRQDCRAHGRPRGPSPAFGYTKFFKILGAIIPQEVAVHCHMAGIPRFIFFSSIFPQTAIAKRNRLLSGCADETYNNVQNMVIARVHIGPQQLLALRSI
jgi:hypothetical protein